MEVAAASSKSRGACEKAGADQQKVNYNSVDNARRKQSTELSSRSSDTASPVVK